MMSADELKDKLTALEEGKEYLLFTDKETAEMLMTNPYFEAKATIWIIPDPNAFIVDKQNVKRTISEHMAEYERDG